MVTISVYCGLSWTIGHPKTLQLAIFATLFLNPGLDPGKTHTFNILETLFWNIKEWFSNMFKISESYKQVYSILWKSPLVSLVQKRLW